jgi:DNA helicase-2/ATP-dependent DNA helicase PcrA
MAILLDQLNPQQRQAVELTEGPSLILAGAGSGKTRVITTRIAYLIESLGVPPETILAVTFTNKAAEQMKERVERLVTTNPPKRPEISTFHSFCVRVLRREVDKLGRSRDFTIYDEDDQARLLKAAIAELGLAEQIPSPRGALARISYAKNRGLSPEDLFREAQDPTAEKLALLYERYERKLAQAQALDFDDLLLKTVSLFDTVGEVSERYNAWFRYILVDEFQDTNRIQYQIIRQLTRLHQNLCVVGDEDQSIYRWRGADIQNILNFEKDYATAKIIRLEENYRSTQLILDSATAVVSRNLARKGKTLRSNRGGGERLSLFEARDAEEEGQFVASWIARALASNGAQTVAVLYRTNSQSRIFEEALRHRGIDYRLVGGFSFYARAEIKDVLAYARLANNPRDPVAFLRIVNTPARGIGETTLASLAESARKGNLSLWEALERELSTKELPGRALEALKTFHAVMREILRDRERMTMSELFRSLLTRSGYREMLQKDELAGSEDRIENLEELLNAVAEAEERGETLAEFLDHAALVSDADDFDERARVTLMTLHSAKGLEFSAVLLVGLEEGLFPHKLSVQDDAAIEEERRLCYVGMTRAKDRLLLTWARQRRAFGMESRELTRPSRFIGEIPRELFEPLAAVSFGAKPRTTWENAYNSVASVERVLSARGRAEHGIQRPRSDTFLRTTVPRRWELGSQVRHPTYGVGTILHYEGEGVDTKLTISFPGYGRKKFIEGKASLEKA